MKKIIFILFVVCSLFFIACGGEQIPEEKEENKVFENLTDVVLAEGDTYKFEYQEELLIVVEDTTILSSNDSEKTITALKGGETTVTVFLYNDLSVSKEIKVTVEAFDILSVEAINKWLESLYKDIVVDKDIELVTTYKNTDVELFFDLIHQSYLSSTGVYKAPVVDTPSTITYIYYLEGTEYELVLPITIKGYSNNIDATEMWINKYFKDSISYDYQMPTYCDEYNTTLKWFVNGVELVDGKLLSVSKDQFDREVSFTYEVTYKDETKAKEVSVYVSSLNDLQKAEVVARNIKENYKSLVVEDDITLEKTDDLFNSRIVWKTWAEHILTANGKFIMPLNSQKIKMQISVYVNTEVTHELITLNVKGLDATDMWGKIEDFLDRINVKDVKNQTFYLYGCEEGYYTVKTSNYGYLPFYNNDELKVTEDILPDDSPLKANSPRTSTNYVTIHNTGMAHPTATAKGLNEYIHTTDRVASWHFSVDDKEAYQELKLGEIGWHAGDGSHYYGDYWFNSGVWCIGGGNRNSVGLETCVYSGVDYNMVMRNTAKLVSKLLVYYNLSTSDVRQHYDFSGKDCPQVLRQAGRWAEQLELIELEYFARTQLKGVVFEFKSLSPEIMDDMGRVFSTRPKAATKVSYQVSVTYNNETKVYNYESTLNKL